MTNTSDITYTPAEVAGMVDTKVTSIGGASAAAKRWKVSPQMVHMVIKGKRRPSPAMLKDLELEEVKSLTYQPRKSRKKAST